MFRLDFGRTGRYCDGYNRRSFLQLGVAGMASLGLADVWRAKAHSAPATGETKNTSVILLWLDGGPSHMDTFDYKPKLYPLDGKSIPVETFGRGGHRNEGRVVGPCRRRQ